MAQQNQQSDERYRTTLRVTLVGAVVDLLLGVGKIIVGFVAQSQALIADGIHSLSDLATDGLVLYAAKHANRAADAEHPYGHARVETAVTVILGVFLIGIAVGISIDAIMRLFAPEQLWIPGFWALILAVLSIGAKEAIYHYTIHAARKYRSNMLRANAWHSRSDALSSVIVVVGIGGTMMGLIYLDAIAAVAVALMVAKIGWDLAWQGLRELMDTALEPEQVEKIKAIIKKVDGVKALHMLRTRRMGPNAFVDVHIQVDSRLSVSEGHYISEIVRSRLIQQTYDVEDVTVHIDPEDDQSQQDIHQLPSRSELLKKLGELWKDMEISAHIERVVLHYIDGKVEVDVIVPKTLFSELDGGAQRQVTEQFNNIAVQIAGVDSISLYYH